MIQLAGKSHFQSGQFELAVKTTLAFFGKGTRKYDDVPYKIKNFPLSNEGLVKGVLRQ